MNSFYSRICKTIFGLGLVGFTSPALACPFVDSDIISLLRNYKEKPDIISNIVVVTVSDVFKSKQGVWIATARRPQPLRGRLRYGFTFGQKAQTSCREYPAPKTGDLWVVYFWRAPDGSEQELAAHPLGAAAKFDPVYGAKMRAMLAAPR